MNQCSSTLKKLSLELGGNAPFIVFDDADIDAAVEGAINSKFRNSGQTCVCVNRFYAQDKVYEEFVSKLSKAIAALKIGNGLSSGVQIGPLISKKGSDKVKRHVQDEIEKGAVLVQGGKELRAYFISQLF
jgi:succinate-semialdehyde dehydrogenase/glutarate-semialdehyde dehydrogenase